MGSDQYECVNLAQMPIKGAFFPQHSMRGLAETQTWQYIVILLAYRQSKNKENHQTRSA